MVDRMIVLGMVEAMSIMVKNTAVSMTNGNHDDDADNDANADKYGCQHREKGQWL